MHDYEALICCLKQELNVINQKEIYFEIAKYYRKLYNLNQSEYYYSLAIINFENDIDVYLERGIFYYEIGAYTKALNDYNYICKLDPENPHVYNNLGLVYEKLNQFERSINCFKNALKFDSKNDKANRNLANVYFKSLNDYNNALYYCNKQLEVVKTDLNSYDIALLERGKIYYNLNQLKEAYNDFKTVLNFNLSRDYKFACIYYQIATCYSYLEDFKIALIYYEKAINDSYKCSSCKYGCCHKSYFKLGKIYEGLNDYNKALTYYNKAYKVYPDDKYDIALNNLLNHIKTYVKNVLNLNNIEIQIQIEKED